MSRILKNMMGVSQVQGHWLRHKHFTAQVLDQVAQRIHASEQGHSGELVLAVEAVMPSHETDSHLRALEVFGRLRVWDTPLNSGVLLYLALDQRYIEIVADRGITASAEQWQAVCTKLQQAFGRKAYVEGLLQAVEDIEAILRRAAPPLSVSDEPNYLPDEPVLL
ncbi:TPM domain-containing protein [Paenalcaligenes sp. Me131]|uniref:TPM domain-containing protein n=1 Tax=Paenalcaligenes sp. Me131 TaxID=3392636 RepID=UPI003D2D69CD